MHGTEVLACNFESASFGMCIEHTNTNGNTSVTYGPSDFRVDFKKFRSLLFQDCLFKLLTTYKSFSSIILSCFTQFIYFLYLISRKENDGVVIL